MMSRNYDRLDAPINSPICWPLHRAVLCNNLEKLTCLLEIGCDPDSTGYQYNLLNFSGKISDALPLNHEVAPIHLAVIRNDIEAVKVLIRFDANINTVSGKPYRMSPLQLAIQFNYNAIAETLITSGANLAQSDPKGFTCLELAEVCNSDVLNVLRNMLSVWRNRSNNFLHEYCAQSVIFRQRVIRKVTDQGVDINGVNFNKETPLHLLLKRNMDRESVCNGVKILIKYGSNVNLTDSDGNTPFMIAIIRGLPTALLAILAPKGTAINATNVNGYNGLALAILCGVEEKKVTLLQFLLEKGADLYQETKDGKNLLNLVTKGFSTSLHLLEFLLQKGFTPNIEDLKSSLVSNKLTFVNALLKYWDKRVKIRDMFPDVLVLLVEAEFGEEGLLLSILRTLILEHEVNVNHVTSGCDSLLHSLIKGNSCGRSSQCVDYLLTMDHLDVDIETKYGTPLTHAFLLQDYAMAVKLILNFADISKLDLTSASFAGGFSTAFCLLFDAGYHFAAIDENAFLRSSSLSKEFVCFKEWFLIKSKQVQPLTQMAARTVRQTYGKEVFSLLSECDLSSDIESALVLKEYPISSCSSIGMDSDDEREDRGSLANNMVLINNWEEW